MSAKTRMRHGLGTILAALTAGGLLLGAGPAASAQTTSTASAASKPGGTVTAPTNLHVVSETFTDLNLAWNASSGSGVQYELFIDNNVYAKYPLDTPSVDVEIGPGTGLDPGSTHTFQVQAFNGDGGKALSNKLTVTLGPGDSTAPTAPSNVHVVSQNADGVTLGWDPSSDPDSPDLTYFLGFGGCASAGSTGGFIPSQSVNPVCGITPGETYTASVFSQDPSGNDSPRSNTVTFTYNG